MAEQSKWNVDWHILWERVEFVLGTDWMEVKSVETRGEWV